MTCPAVLPVSRASLWGLGDVAVAELRCGKLPGHKGRHSQSPAVLKLPVELIWPKGADPLITWK